MHDRKATAQIPALIVANVLFDRVVKAIGLHKDLARLMLIEVLAIVGSNPEIVTLAEMGLLLPEIDRRIRLLNPEAADDSMRRVRRLLLA
jgi:hypothetical protein